RRIRWRDRAGQGLRSLLLVRTRRPSASRAASVHQPLVAGGSRRRRVPSCRGMLPPRGRTEEGSAMRPEVLSPFDADVDVALPSVPDEIVAFMRDQRGTDLGRYR